MSDRTRRALVPCALALLMCCVNPAPGWAANNCGGGGKPRPDEGGIGGTGFKPVVPEEDDSGIGGTGISAHGDTGIIGTITGFASICVGGVEIHYGADSVLQIDGATATAAQLAVGQLVEVVASGTGADVRARQISVRHIVAGPVTGVDPERNALEVIGQAVQLPPDTRVADGERAPFAMARDYVLGAFVQISGLRRSDGVIVASLVTRGQDGVSQLTGPVERAEVGLLAVGGTQVRLAGETRVAVGDEVRVIGQWDGSMLVSTALEALPRLPFGGRVGRVEIEGYARREGTGQLQVGAFVFDVPPTTSPAAIAPDVPIRVRAVIQDRRAIVEHIGVLSERPTRPEPHDGGTHGWQHHPGSDQRAVEGREGVRSREHHDSAPPGSIDKRPEIDAPARPDRPSAEAPLRPDRPDQSDRPDRAAPPERPPRIERPQAPDRGFIPERPPRPERPEIPRRP